MMLLVLILSLAIVTLLAYRFWEPFTVTPKREVRVGSATLYFVYTDWGGFSKKAMPVWEEVEEKLRENPVFGTTKVTPVRVNGDSERALISLYEIEGYPTIKLETSSALIDYTGKRTVADILSFLRETLG